MPTKARAIVFQAVRCIEVSFVGLNGYAGPGHTGVVPRVCPPLPRTSWMGQAAVLLWSRLRRPSAFRRAVHSRGSHRQLSAVLRGRIPPEGARVYSSARACVYDPIDKKACQGASGEILGEPGGLPNLPGGQAMRRLLQEGHNDAAALGHRAAGRGTRGVKRRGWPVRPPWHRPALYNEGRARVRGGL